MAVRTLSSIVHEESRIDLPNTKRLVPLPDDLIFIIDTRDNIEDLHDLWKGDGHESHMIKKMMDFALAGETYVEVGVHYGDFALRMSQKIGPNAMIYGFEPNKNLYQCFSTSVFLNGITNIVSENLAVLDKVQKVGFFENAAISLMSNVVTNNNNYASDQEIMAVTLDSYFEGKESSIDIIRLDAEGSECKALRGAQKIIDSSPDIRLFIEWQSALLNKYENITSLQECLSSLLGKGFVFLDTAEFNKNCDYKNYKLSINDIIDNEVLEVLAIREEALKNFTKADYFSNQAEECLEGLHNLLHLSITRNNTERLKFALKHGVNIDRLHSIGATPLYWAAQEGKFEIAKILLDAGANIEIKAANSMTPLTISVQNNDFNMTKLFIDTGADLENPNGKGSTSVYLAAYFGYNDILQLLLENGANKDVQVQGISAFYVALQNDHTSTAKIIAGSNESFCNKIQGSGYETKYIEFCGEFIDEF